MEQNEDRIDKERDEEAEKMEGFEASPSEPTEVLRDLDKAFRQLEEPGEEPEEKEEERPSTRDLAAELAAEVEAETEEKPAEPFAGISASWEEAAAEAKAEKPPPEPTPEEVIAKELAAEKEQEEAPPAPEPGEEVEKEEVPPPPPPPPGEVPVEEAAEPSFATVSEQPPTVDVSAGTAPLETAAPQVDVNMDELRTTFESAAPVEGVEQLPRGAKYRRIRKEQLLQMVAELVRRYAASALQQLAARNSQLQQLQETLASHQAELQTFRSRAESLQKQLSEREARISSMERELEELREQAEKMGTFGEKWLEKEDEYIRRIKELEQEATRLRSALETSGTQLQQKIEQLEQQIAVYKGKLEELQRGLEYVGFVEEFDVAGGLLQAAELRTKLEELTSGVGEATTRMIPASVRERLEFITAKTREIEEKLNRYRDNYSGLVAKMEGGDGTIAVAVDTAVMAERIRGLTDQLRIVAQMLEMVEAFIR